MSTGDLVSVIIPAKNGERYIGETIESVLAQTYENIDVTVVDGNSTDDTRKIAASFPSVRIIREEGEANIANARNIGIDNAKGEFISIVSCDDKLVKNKLEMQVRALKERPGTQYCICKLRFFLSEGMAPPKNFRMDLLNRDVLGYMPETLLARKSLFATLGYFNPVYGMAEDLEWFQRARDLDIPMVALEETLLLKRVHDQNFSSNSEVELPDTMRLLRDRIRQARNHSANE